MNNSAPTGFKTVSSGSHLMVKAPGKAIEHMKAIIWTKYGPPEVLQAGEVEKPIPKDNQVLIKIHAATVSAGDCEVRRFEIARWIWLPLRLYMGVFKPRIKILGQEFAGKIVSIGKNVTQFKPGDSIFAPTQMNFGAYAEYICLPANYIIAHKPANISYEEAATIPTGGLNALHFIRKANINRACNTGYPPFGG